MSLISNRQIDGIYISSIEPTIQKFWLELDNSSKRIYPWIWGKNDNNEWISSEITYSIPFVNIGYSYLMLKYNYNITNIKIVGGSVSPVNSFVIANSAQSISSNFAQTSSVNYNQNFLTAIFLSSSGVTTLVISNNGTIGGNINFFGGLSITGFHKRSNL